LKKRKRKWNERFARSGESDGEKSQQWDRKSPEKDEPYKVVKRCKGGQEKNPGKASKMKEEGNWSRESSGMGLR